MLERVGNNFCFLERSTRRKVYFNGKLVALGRRHHLLWQQYKENAADDNRKPCCRHDTVRVTETEVDKLIIAGLHKAEERETRLAVFAQTLLNGFANKVKLQERSKQFCHD